MKLTGNIIRYFAGIFFIVMGAASLATHDTVWGILWILLGYFIMPLLWSQLKKRKIPYKKWIPVLLPVLLFFGVVLTVPQNNSTTAEVAETTWEEDSNTAKPTQEAVTTTSVEETTDAQTPQATTSPTKTARKKASTTPKATATPEVTEEASHNLSMHVIDVGQGLSLLFESGGHYLLYDGGDRDYSSTVVSYLKSQNVQTLDYVIASHYDSDHLNGVVGALHVFDAEMVIAPDYAADTRVYRSFLSAVEQQGLTLTYPVPHTQYELGNCTFTILSPLGNDYADVNDYSIAIRLVCGDTSFIATGDATVESEEEMLADGETLDSDILVVGHHGSAGSTCEEFLQNVSPSAAIISCGENNQYQHPSQEVMERMQANNIPVFRTDKQGNIILSSDGEEIAASVDPCNDYSYGTKTTAEATPKTASSSNGSSNFDTYDNEEQQQTEDTYVLNNSTMKFHYPSCSSVPKIAPHNYGTSSATKEELIAQGYSPCGNCNP